MKPILKLILLGFALLLSPPVQAATTVTNVSAGGQFSLFIRSDGSLWGMGYNYNGQLGLGSNSTTSPYGPTTPMQIVSNGVTTVAGGGEHSLLLKTNGSLWAMGYNPYGELGNGTYANTNTPQLIVAGNVTAIAAGWMHSLFLKSDGSLWTMGDNTYGQLGVGGTYSKTNIPQQILSSNVTAIAAGDYFNLFLKTDGSLWGFGANGSGQLGTGNTTGTNAPVMIVASNVTAMAAGNAHSLLLKTDGSLWAMGDNSSGQLGRGNFASTNAPVKVVSNSVMAIEVGSAHSLFIKTNGSLWVMGAGGNGQLGTGGNTNVTVPQQIVSNNVTAIQGGRYHSLFLKSDGSLWGMGYNSAGTLGDGSTTSRRSPVQIVPALQFTATPASGVAQLNVQFNAPGVDTAGNTITQWNWNFGDGATSTAQNPSHVYSNAATFLPSLIATNNAGVTVLGMGPSISVSFPTVQFTAPTNFGVAPFTVQFSCPAVDSASNNIVQWNWNFGDGTTSTAQNPLHTFNTNGPYYVTLMATNSQGTTVVGSGPTIVVASYSGLVLNGNFEVGIAGWSNTSFFYPIGAGPIYAHSGTYGVQFLQPGGPLAFLSQTLATTVGGQYLLSFWLNSPDGSAPNQFRVSWDGNTLLDKTNLTAFGWTNIQFTVTATGTNTVLQFGYLTSFSSFNGLGLDDVSVVPVVTPQLRIASFSLAGTNLVVNGINGLSNRIYRVLMGTNAAQPLSQWTPVATNVLSADGNFTINATNAVNPGAARRFYILHLQ